MFHLFIKNNKKKKPKKGEILRNSPLDRKIGKIIAGLTDRPKTKARRFDVIY